MSYNLIYDKICDDPLLSKVIDKLLYNQLVQNKFQTAEIKVVSLDDLKKAAWLVSILANSPNENHLVKSQLFTSLLYLQNGISKDVERVCYILMSRLGNLIATKHFSTLSVQNPSINDELNKFDGVLNYELTNQKNDNQLILGEEVITFTKFQKNLWEQLNSEQQISISAPTSTGKSFITKTYIKEQFFNNSNKSYNCLYIVPSRALINQVSEEFRIDLSDIAKVKTSFLEPNDDSNCIYVLTPERCLRLLKYAESVKIKMDLIFIDEIQNIEEEGGRGTLLEHVISLLGSIFFESQIITAGPYISNPQELFLELLQKKAQKIKTTVSPVIQIRSVIRGLGNNNVSIKLLSNIEDENSLVINLGYDLNSTLNSSIGKGLTGLINLLAQNENSLIYAPKTNLAESWARHNANQQPEISNIERRLNELIEYLSEEIHPLYYLVKCLKKRVAFHHGRLPEMVRKEVEDCFIAKEIKTLFCTATLIEGVNLPARNLFIVIPKKNDLDLSPFEFGNLVGRAGRIRDSLYGNVYCVEKSDYSDWAKFYFQKPFEKTVVPATRKALNNLNTLIKNLRLPSTEIDKKEELEKNTIILFRHKFYSDSDNFTQYLKNKDLSEENINLVTDELKVALSSITIPESITKNNPSIDILLQDKLYNQILAEGVENWVIHYNINITKRITKEEISQYNVQDRNLYWQLRYIMEKMDDIFHIKDEVDYKHKIYRKISQMCLYGVRWLQGLSYAQIIKEDIAWKTKSATVEYPFDPTNETDINKVINDLSKINNTIVSHVLVKYLKVLNDILEPLMTDRQLEEYKFSMALPGMLELGTTNGNVIKLISAGVSRSVAIKVHSIFSKINGHEEMDVFDWLKSQRSLNMKPIYNRYLSKLRLLKIDMPQ